MTYLHSYKFIKCMNISKYLNVQGAEFHTNIVNLRFLIIMVMHEVLNFF